MKININSLIELEFIAIKPKNEGEKDLFRFLSENSSKNVSDVIDKTWDLNSAPEKQQNESLTRMEKLNVLMFCPTLNALRVAIKSG